MGGLVIGVHHHHPRPPPRPLHPQVIWRAYSPSGASRSTGRNCRCWSGFGVNMLDITAVSGGQWRRLKRQHEPWWYRSYCHSGRPCMGRHTGLGGRLVVQIHARRWPGPWKWTWMAQHAGMLIWAEVPDVEPQPGRDVGDVGAFHGGREEEFPGIRRSEPYTSSADAAITSSFLALRITKRTNGRTSAQCSSAWHIRAAFSWRRSPWIILFEVGKERHQIACWSVVICWGQPKRATQMETKALGTASVVISERGSDSDQRMYLSMPVRQYRKPEDTCSGPTMSIRTWEKRADGKLKFSRGTYTCRVTLKRWQGVHTRVSMLGNLSPLPTTQTAGTPTWRWHWPRGG